jgi:hypothetical protein
MEHLGSFLVNLGKKCIGYLKSSSGLVKVPQGPPLSNNPSLNFGMWAFSVETLELLSHAWLREKRYLPHPLS